MENKYQKWIWKKQGEKCVNNLKKNGFDARFVSTSDQACLVILDRILSYKTFGFGGSDTTREIGILDALKNKGKTIYDHWPPNPDGVADLDIRLKQGRCDCFICSANAISVQGEIVNVDGVGNRTSAMCFGPKKVVIVAGMNKVRPDLESALNRVHEIAGPMRAKSLEMKTPCAETGVCSNCNSPQRICRITTILHRQPMLTDIMVVLVNQELGF